jgi:hypothetical protein
LSEKGEIFLPEKTHTHTHTHTQCEVLLGITEGENCFTYLREERIYYEMGLIRSTIILWKKAKLWWSEVKTGNHLKIRMQKENK